MATEPKHVTVEEEVSIKQLILSINDWVKYLGSKWRIFLFTGVFGGLIGLGYSLIKTPLFIATTTFVVEAGESKGGLGRLAGMAAIAGIDFGGSAGGLFQGDNILELYKSRRMLVQALLSKVHADSSELLVERYLTYNRIRENWKEQPDLLSIDFRKDPSTLDSKMLRLRDSVMTSLTNTIRSEILKVEKPDKNLSIVRVDVMSPDEAFSKGFNESLVKEVNDFYIQTKTQKSMNNITMLQNKVDSVRAVMEGAIYSAAKASDATPNLNPTRQVQRIVPAQEAQFSAEANKAMLAQLLQNLEFSRMNLLQEQPLIQLVDQPVYPLPRLRLGKVKAIVIGGFFFGFLTALSLVFVRYFRQIMVDDERR